MQYADVMQKFADRHALNGLTENSIKHLYDGDFSLDRANDFIDFYRRLETELLTHPVITDNPYTRWFKKGDITDGDVRHLIVQFSVFTNQFLVAQVQKMISAHNLEEMRATKEILANEIGVIFRDPSKGREPISAGSGASFSGSVEGGIFHFSAAHFESLVRLADHIGLRFDELGRREHGTPTTLFFCDELIRLYGSSDYATCEAASFAVEHWGAAGFWRELIQGLECYKQRDNVDMPLGFFTWHDRLKDNHARHTREELENYYFTHNVDEKLFIDKGSEMLDGVYAFWKGLDDDHRRLH